MSTAVKKAEEKVVELENKIIVPNLPQFSEEEIQTGGDAESLGYVERFPYMVRTDGSEFVISGTTDETRETEVYRGKTLEVVAFYGHDVWRLQRGAVEGLTSDSATWTPEQKAIVAQTYASPFSNLRASRGSFDAAGFGRYLDNKELRKAVKKRLYLGVAVPGVLPVGSLAICTFGATAILPYQRYNSALQRIKCPVSYIKTELSLKRTTNDAGQKYDEVVFRQVVDTEGRAVVPWESKNQWDRVAVPLINKLKKLHADVIAAAEAYIPPAPEPEEKPAQGVTVVDGVGGFDDEIVPEWNGDLPM